MKAQNKRPFAAGGLFCGAHTFGTDGEGGEDDTTESGFPQIVQDGEYHTLACAFRKVGP